MNIDEIRQLVELLENSSLDLLEVEEGETRVRLEKKGAPAPLYAAPQQTPVPIPQAAASAEEEQGTDFNNLHEISAPVVGVFYRRPSPEAEPYVQVGSRVKKGDTLCIVEAMKLMNEITADRDGEIADICATDGDVVEYGQTLFKMF